MTRSQAVLRGAVLGAIVSVLVVGGAVAWVATEARAGSSPASFGGLLGTLLLRTTRSQPPASHYAWPGGLYILGGTVIGMLLGFLAGGLRGSVRRRVVILLALAPVGPWLLAASIVALPILRDAIQHRSLAGLLPAIGAPLLALPYVVLMAPIFGPPVVLGHLLLEGWTRPDDLPASGLARPSVRRWVLAAVSCVTLVLVVISFISAPS